MNKDDFDRAAKAKAELELLHKRLEDLHHDIDALQKPGSVAKRFMQFAMAKKANREILERKREALKEAEWEFAKNLKSFEAGQKEMAEQAMKAAAERQALSGTQNNVVLMRPLQFKPRANAQVQEF